MQKNNPPGREAREGKRIFEAFEGFFIPMIHENLNLGEKFIMNKKLNELEGLCTSDNLFFIKTLADQMTDNNNAMSQAILYSDDVKRIKSQFDYSMKRQNILLALVVKLADETDKKLNAAVELINELENLKE